MPLRISTMIPNGLECNRQCFPCMRFDAISTQGVSRILVYSAECLKAMCLTLSSVSSETSRSTCGQHSVTASLVVGSTPP